MARAHGGRVTEARAGRPSRVLTGGQKGRMRQMVTAGINPGEVPRKVLTLLRGAGGPLSGKVPNYAVRTPECPVPV
jgi:hypothetical protein